MCFCLSVAVILECSLIVVNETGDSIMQAGTMAGNGESYSREEYKKRSNTGDEVFVRIQKQAPEVTSAPTAVLFGWLGSKPRHVLKYGYLYEEMGYHLVYTTAPSSVTFPLTPRIVTKYVLSILRIIASDRRLTCGGLVIHMFSNGGGMCAPFLAQLLMGNVKDVLHADDKVVIKTIKDAICGVVFDSGPVNLRTRLGANAICDSLGVSNLVLRTLIWMLFALVCLVQQVLVINLREEFWNGVTQAEYFSPEVYIYSRADKVLDVPALEQLVERRKQAGHDVRTLAVNDCEHVRILLQYEDRYCEIVKQLNDDGVNSWRARRQLPSWIVSVSGEKEKLRE